MKKAILIAIPVLLIVYVLFVCVPYTGQGAATEETMRGVESGQKSCSRMKRR